MRMEGLFQLCLAQEWGRVDGVAMVLERDDDVEESDRRILALYEWLVDNDKCALSEISECRYSCYGMTTYEVGGREYAIADDDEADDAQDAAFDSYLDDGCVEGADGPYFDTAAWKRDAKMDSRGHTLSHYDGHEHECREYFIYRMN